MKGMRISCLLVTFAWACQTTLAILTLGHMLEIGVWRMLLVGVDAVVQVAFIVMGMYRADSVELSSDLVARDRACSMLGQFVMVCILMGSFSDRLTLAWVMPWLVTHLVVAMLVGTSLLWEQSCFEFECEREIGFALPAGCTEPDDAVLSDPSIGHLVMAVREPDMTRDDNDESDSDYDSGSVSWSSEQPVGPDVGEP